MNKQILVSLLVIGVVGAVASGSTFAEYTDVEASTGNFFRAGNLDLEIGWNSSYSGAELVEYDDVLFGSNQGAIFTLNDVKPGDMGEATIFLRVNGNPGWVLMNLTRTENDDVSSTEPELKTGDAVEDPGNISDGELWQSLYFTVWYDDGDNVYQEGEDVIFNGSALEIGNFSKHYQVTVVENFGFESPVVTSGSGWQTFGDSAVPGWTVEWTPNSGDGQDPACEGVEPQLEYHRGVNSWSPQEGAQYVELDTDCSAAVNGEKASVTVSQVSTVPGEDYNLVYYWSPRPGHADNQMDVEIDGSTVNTHSASGASNSDTDWTREEVSFTASDSTTEIAFTETGTPDSMGMFLDNVQIIGSTGSLQSGVWIDGDVDQIGLQPFDANQTEYVAFKWWLPYEVGNEIQSDQVKFDLQFDSVQRRHNPNP